VPITFWIAAVGLVIGAGMGVLGLVRPDLAARIVRLREDQPGGAAEFRATYGGLFLFAHGKALGLWFLVLHEVESFMGVPTYWTGMGMLAVCSVIWLGSAFGRTVSVLADSTGGAFNYGSIAFELAMTLLIAAPWFEFLLRNQ
jgi:hypothetical protein